MRTIDVIRKPRKCPHCGGEVYKILYGEPICSEEEYFERFGKHVVFGGCCITGNDPEYECVDCGMKFYTLPFPRNANAIAREVLLKEEPKLYCGVEYIGLYKKMMTFRAVVSPDYVCDGFHLVFVKQDGTTKQMIGYKILEIIENIKKSEEKLLANPDKLAWYAAWREIRDERDYYKTVRKIGKWCGKLVYVPVLHDYLKNEPLCIGLPLVILVDKKGEAEYIRDERSFRIIHEIEAFKKLEKKNNENETSN